ncbi:MAG: diversity-generating retroelement protein Avd [Chloroflexi bacterium]|nr:diversity-generating retroelement protein Avd [Chloroflexota bacterium]
MAESPIFVKTYDLLQWLVPRTLKFPREHRFVLATRIQTRAFDLQRALLFAAKASSARDTAQALQRADVELAELRLNLRLALDLTVLDARGYAHVARLTDEVGKLLGGWQRTLAH